MDENPLSPSLPSMEYITFNSGSAFINRRSNTTECLLHFQDYNGNISHKSSANKDALNVDE